MQLQNSVLSNCGCLSLLLDYSRSETSPVLVEAELLFGAGLIDKE
jgi:hypothetical protein